MIGIDGLEVRFGRKTALNDVSLRFPRGECVLLAGPNGAGKTTLLRVLAGVLLPSKGRVQIGTSTMRPGMRTGIAYLPSSLAFYDSLSLGEAVRLVSTFYPGFQFKPAAEYPFELRRRMDSVSRGEKTLFLLSLALSTSPSYLLIDDVLHFLDPHLREAFLQTILRRIEEDGLGVIMAAQSVSDIEGIVERLVVLDRGRTVIDEPLEKLKRNFVRVLADRIPEGLPVVYRHDWQGGSEFYVYPCPDNEALTGRVEHLTLAEMLRAIVGGKYGSA
ncbi:MAG: ABC transporter ATP-binding protein [Acidobacteriota bacterium]